MGNPLRLLLSAALCIVVAGQNSTLTATGSTWGAEFTTSSTTYDSIETAIATSTAAENVTTSSSLTASSTLTVEAQAAAEHSESATTDDVATATGTAQEDYWAAGLPDGDEQDLSELLPPGTNVIKKPKVQWWTVFSEPFNKNINYTRWSRRSGCPSQGLKAVCHSRRVQNVDVRYQPGSRNYRLRLTPIRKLWQKKPADSSLVDRAGLFTTGHVTVGFKIPASIRRWKITFDALSPTINFVKGLFDIVLKRAGKSVVVRMARSDLPSFLCRSSECGHDILVETRGNISNSSEISQNLNNTDSKVLEVILEKIANALNASWHGKGAKKNDSLPIRILPWHPSEASSFAIELDKNTSRLQVKFFAPNGMGELQQTIDLDAATAESGEIQMVFEAQVAVDEETLPAVYNQWEGLSELDCPKCRDVQSGGDSGSDVPSRRRTGWLDSISERAYLEVDNFKLEFSE